MTTPDPTTAPDRPKRRATPTPARVIARLAVEALHAKKGTDITVIDVRHVSGVTDYYVIATGASDLQVRALVESVEDRIREEAAEKPWKREGIEHLQWVVLDYVDVVVHVFDRDRRSFYDLERLWGDAPSEQVADETEHVALLADDGPATR
jgi:ribosome-associated protein